MLLVPDKAKVIYAPREVYLPYGKPALLDCHFRANPPLTNLRWEKDGFLFDPYNVQGVFYRRNGSLYFSKVDETHSGSYTCTPYNELGTEGPSPSITVASPFFKFSPPPHFRSNRSQLIREKLGADRAEAACIHRHPPTLVHKEVGGEFGDTLRREGRGPVSQALDRLVQGEQFCRNETFLLSPPSLSLSINTIDTGRRMARRYR